MITIRKCGLEDISALFDIAVESYTAAYEYLWEDKGAAYLKKFYSTQLMEADIDSYFLVYSGLETAGYFKIKENSFGPYAQKDCLEVEKLYFLPSFTGRGIGTYTIDYIEKLAVAQQKVLIWLSVMQSSPANSFYKSNGFKQVQ
jgi:GNAT superfamily N-acetyltransferase